MHTLIMAIKPNRYYYLLAILIAMSMAVLFYWGGYAYRGPINSHGFSLQPVKGIPTTQKFFFTLVMIMAICFVVLAMRLFILNKAVFEIFEEGFITNTNGMGSELIEWKEIKCMREDTVQSKSTNGLRRQRVLVFYFKDPNYYYNSQNKMVKSIMRLANYTRKLNYLGQLGAEADGYPLVLNANDFGKKYAAAFSVMQAQIEKYA